MRFNEKVLTTLRLIPDKSGAGSCCARQVYPCHSEKIGDTFKAMRKGVALVKGTPFLSVTNLLYAILGGIGLARSLGLYFQVEQARVLASLASQWD